MPDRKRIITIGGTLFAIAGIGFFMQTGQPGPSQAALNQVVTKSAEEKVELPSAELTASSTPGATEIALSPPATVSAEAPATEDTAPMEIAALEDTSEMGASKAVGDDPVVRESKQMQSEENAGQTGFQTAALDELTIAVEPETGRPAEKRAANGPDDLQGCDPEMTVETMAAALINVVISADCLPNERVTLDHAGMVFSEATNARGLLEVTIPALDEEAQITATFLDGHAVSASATVSSLSFYDRVVIQSDSDSAITLHALEYGAGYSDRGHVWSGAAGGIENAATGKGGFLITLGDPTMDNARMAEIYTFPTGIAQDDGQVQLSVEIEVTNHNCGRPVDAKALQTGAAGDLDVRSLSLTMPDCDAVGDFLVLKNFVNDLKVARN